MLSKSLRVGDLLKNKSGEWKLILSIEKVLERQATYNFEVEQNHDYFVGENGWLVHNDSQKLLTGIVNEAFTDAENAAYRKVGGKIGDIVKGVEGAPPLESLTMKQRILAARKYLNKAFTPKGNLPSEGVTNFQIDRADFILNGGEAPGPLTKYLKRKGY